MKTHGDLGAGHGPSGLPAGTGLRWGLFVLGSVALCLLGAEGVRSFRPPSTATVDIAEVFEGYSKKKDRQAELEGETRQLEGKLKELELKYKDVLQEIPQLKSGESKDRLMLEKSKLEIEVRAIKERELERLRELQVQFLREIREEISNEIAAYAEAQKLDLIIEKTVTAEAEGQAAGFRWPIVHYVRPEIDITKEITERLNSHYSQAR